MPRSSYGQEEQPTAADVQPAAVAHVADGQVVNRKHWSLPAAQVASQRHELVQSTPRAQAPSPHDARQGPELHSTPAPHAPAPQLAEQLVENEQSMPPSQEPSAQLTEHDPGPHAVVPLQASIPQLTLQLVALEQSMPLTQVLSAQVTLQGPEPQAIRLGQAPAAMHSMSQLDAWLQSMRELQLFSPQVR